MENYTPLDVKKTNKKPSSDRTNVVLIIIAIVTAIILAVILILLINQRLIPSNEPTDTIEEGAMPAPPEIEFEEEASPSPELDEDDGTATPTGEIEVSPTEESIPTVSPAQ